MRIAIIAPGSRGDVQPYIALGKGLKKAGHTIRFVTSLSFETLVNSHGLDLWPVESNMQEIIENEKMREALENGRLLASMAQMGRVMKHNALQLTEKSLAASQGMDMILAGIGGLFIGLSIANKLDLPFLQAFNVPFTPTRNFPGVFLPQPPNLLRGPINRLSHHLTRQIVWQTYRPADKLVRQLLPGLSNGSFWGPFTTKRLKEGPIIYGFSPLVIPRPTDWEKNVIITGYWFLDTPDNWSPPPELIEFFDSGPIPIYIGFGSMSNRKPEETTNLVLQALHETKQRAILLSGWGGLQKQKLPSSVFMIDSIPHSWVFSRVAAVIHHGGAGNTAASLMAGVPSIIIPFHGDQPFWGQRVLELRVGTKPIPRRKLSAKLLAQAIVETMSDKGMRQRAVELGAKIRSEDGIRNAVNIIDNLKPK
jgi:sterol 3beta-glucosyltransferase